MLAATRARILARDQLKLKLMFIAAYGSKCYCCGESNPKFLTVEHLNNDGAKHKKSIYTNAGATAVIRTLWKHGWPKDKGIAVACASCNMGRENNVRIGKQYCPHGPVHLKLVAF